MIYLAFVQSPVYVTNIEDNLLLRNNGDGLSFTEATADAGVGKGEFQRRQRVSWGAVFFDYDVTVQTW